MSMPQDRPLSNLVPTSRGYVPLCPTTMSDKFGTRALEHTPTRAPARHTRYLYGVVLLALACFSLSDWATPTSSVPSTAVSWPDSTLLHGHKPGTVVSAVCPENVYNMSNLDCGSVMCVFKPLDVVVLSYPSVFPRIISMHPQEYRALHSDVSKPHSRGKALSSSTQVRSDILRTPYVQRPEYARM